MPEQKKLIPIYNSRGEIGALLSFPYIYNLAGEWIGWVTSERTVYSVHGHYVGTLTKDPRIVRKREDGDHRPAQKSPARAASSSGRRRACRWLPSCPSWAPR